ncbi:hypothetical protein [Streptomyces daliensis]|uniref:Uncharacterized protein n=1 Tax=Streptomyces daliensis TaxID=299421 RepID=A0A8T4IKF9_9ACTN|nr:hypothetical protein [Streptomyces daliensis]
MTVSAHLRARIQVRGAAIHHSTLLSDGAIPGLTGMSCVDDTVHLDVPEGEFRIDLLERPGQGTLLTFRAVFREEPPAEGTWWSSWETEIAAPAASPQVSGTLVAEINESRRRFAAALADARAHALASTATATGPGSGSAPDSRGPSAKGDGPLAAA